jgi:hypothetical protein
MFADELEELDEAFACGNRVSLPDADEDCPEEMSAHYKAHVMPRRNEPVQVINKRGVVENSRRWRGRAHFLPLR